MRALHGLLLWLAADDGPLLRFGAREFWAFDGGMVLTRDRVIRWEWRKPGYVPATFRGVRMRFPQSGED